MLLVPVPCRRAASLNSPLSRFSCQPVRPLTPLVCSLGRLLLITAFLTRSPRCSRVGAAQYWTGLWHSPSDPSNARVPRPPVLSRPDFVSSRTTEDAPVTVDQVRRSSARGQPTSSVLTRIPTGHYDARLARPHKPITHSDVRLTPCRTQSKVASHRPAMASASYKFSAANPSFPRTRSSLFVQSR